MKVTNRKLRDCISHYKHNFNNYHEWLSDYIRAEMVTTRKILPVLSGQHDIIQSVGLKVLIAVAGNDPPGSGTVDCLEALCEDIMTVI